MGQDDGFRIVELPPEPDPDEGVAAAQADTQADLSELPRSLWAGGREGQEALPHDSTARDMCSCGDLHQLWLEEPRMVGEQVQDLQEGLKVAGHYNGLADGVFGPGTDRAVRAFQARVGLPQDGIVDMEVWMALGKTCETIVAASLKPSGDIIAGGSGTRRALWRAILIDTSNLTLTLLETGRPVSQYPAWESARRRRLPLWATSR